MKKTAYLFGVVSILSMATVSAQAADIIRPQSDNGDVVVAGQPHHNAYAAGNSVTVSGPITGDLVTVGGSVNVTGSVEQDVLGAAGTISINAPVGGDVRVAGGKIFVNAPIKGDAVMAGGTVSVATSSQISGDALIAGNTIMLNAPVNGYVQVAATSVYINSKISGEVDVFASQQLVFGPHADVAGVINFKGTAPAQVESGAHVSAINYTQIQPSGFRKKLAGLLSLLFLAKLIAYMLAGFVFLYFFKNWFYELAAEVQKKPLAMFGWGLAAATAIPLATVILFFTVIGYYLGFMLVALYIPLLVFSNLVASLLLGALLIRLLVKNDEVTPDWQVVVIGVVLWNLAQIIPILGWFFCAALFLVVFGGTVIKLKKFKMGNKE